VKGQKNKRRPAKLHSKKTVQASTKQISRLHQGAKKCCRSMFHAGGGRNEKAALCEGLHERETNQCQKKNRPIRKCKDPFLGGGGGWQRRLSAKKKRAAIAENNKKIATKQRRRPEEKAERGGALLGVKRAVTGPRFTKATISGPGGGRVEVDVWEKETNCKY